MSRRLLSSLLAMAALAVAQAGQAQSMDPANPTCPLNPGWSDHREMQFTVTTIEGRRVLLGEGVIDDNLLPRLEAALRDPDIWEVRLRSPGGNARVGNQAGILLRRSGLPTRIPAGWACAGSCAFMFMGGIVRAVDPGGLIIMQMFTFTGDRETIGQQIARGPEATADLMSEIALQSARLASEDNDYLIRMGVARPLLTDIAYRQRGVSEGDSGPDRRCLTQAELTRYNVTNQAVRRP
jgi:hypothetical protein